MVLTHLVMFKFYHGASSPAPAAPGRALRSMTGVGIGVGTGLCLIVGIIIRIF